MRVCLFEDREVGDLEPLTLTRPVFDLRMRTAHPQAAAMAGDGPSTEGAVP